VSSGIKYAGIVIGFTMNKMRSAVWLPAGLALMLIASSVPVRAADALDHWTTITLTNLNSQVAAPNAIVIAVAYGNDRYVAVGNYFFGTNGFIETSDDGVRWTVRADGAIPFLTPPLYDVVFANGRFVAVGGYFASPHRNLFTSTNGIDWLSATNGTVDTFEAVAYGNGSFVAVGGGTPANVYTSTDATNWIPCSSGTHTLYDVVFGADRFVAVDSLGNAYMSLTGTNWTQVAVGGSAAVTFGDGQFFMPGTSGHNYMSPDGLAWTLATNNVGNTFGHITYARGLYSALSFSTLFTSTDGTNWTARGINTSEKADLAYGPTNLVAVGFTSPTPYKATVIVSDPFVSLNTVANSAHGLFVSGLQNHSYQLDYKTNLTDVDWNPLATFTLTNSPYLWTDTSATNAQRFYRAGLLP